MNITLINSPADPDRLCGTAAAICTNASRPDSALRGALTSGHESVAEHACFTFCIQGVSRVLLAQLTRHRLASYSVQSQRYCGVKPTWVVPETVREAGFEQAYMQGCNDCFNIYRAMISKGVPEEDARYVIPQGVTCDLVFTANARELRHFFALRMCNRAQREIRELADHMHEICVKTAPALFRNSGCGCMTTRGCPERKPCGHPRKE